MSDFSLDTKYLCEEGTIFLSGIQALVRLPMDQHRADRRRSLNTATLVSGYRGSPLGGLDTAFERNQKLLAEHSVVFLSGVNEDLAATAIYGSQIANLFPKPKYDGVLGMWYGKGPGVDRAGDIFKHANFAGVGRNGGVLALGGDDPFCKSSTLPTHSEIAFYDASFPVLSAGSVQEILDLGRLGFELSRYSGLWVGFKIVANVADEISTAEVAPKRVRIADPGFVFEGRPWAHTQNPKLLPPFSLEMEREVHYGRLEAAKAFAAANGLNRIALGTQNAWLGIAAPGKTYYDLREALEILGLDDAALARYGIRLLRIGMLSPMEPRIVREFADGLEELLIVEEKRAFTELFIREILYNQARHPRIVGKNDENGSPLVPIDGELDADRVARLLAPRLRRRIAALPELPQLDAGRNHNHTPITVQRSPYFCSGCPHNRSTAVPEGSLAGAGIGCHAMALWMRTDTMGITHMGGEGAQWIGMAPFSELPHMFQNIGDGTLFHSGSLSIRQAVAAGTSITYKILYNSAVAMTGGQDAAGALPVPELTRLLEAEGVKRTLVVADDPHKYPRKAHWAEDVAVWPRDRLDEAQRLLREVPGVTALIYDQRCAAEKRRLRKRRRLEDPPERVVINEAVCEGCGDCGAKSNCLSVYPVETEFGRKTQIHQGSCNKDYTCLEGDCPSFLTIAASGPARNKTGVGFTLERELPEPTPAVPAESDIFMMGIGGTGVVTVNQILGVAAMLDGRFVRGLDQTGLSQKGGPVVSHLKISTGAREISNKIIAGGADCYLVFDLLTGATAQSLAHGRPDRTIAIVSTSRVPTGEMIRSTAVAFPELRGLVDAINRVSRKERNVYLDAIAIAELLFDDHMAANLVLLGAAYQAGAIAIAAESIERAISLNGIAAQMNTQAFRAGRLAVVDPKWAQSLHQRRIGAVEPEAPSLTPPMRELIERFDGGELRRTLEIRVAELAAYQNLDYARRYVEFVATVRQAEKRTAPEQTRLSEAVARYLYKLMAYKDEYEVARLHLKTDFADRLSASYPGGVTVKYLLHPPLLRALGFKRKLRLGQWFRHGFRLLAAMRGLRGTRFDPFGYARVRREERSLIGEYRELIQRTIAELSIDNYEQAVRLANLPDLIRGYEELKLRNIAIFRSQAATILNQDGAAQSTAHPAAQLPPVEEHAHPSAL